MVEVKYCFHHVPKTAGSSLQLRLCHREYIGELPKGSTLIVYPFKGDTRFYRVSEDPDFDPNKPIRDVFQRTWNKPKTVGSASIVMGHMTTIGQAGEHSLWLREPLARDVSHFNYDMKSNSTLSKNFYEHTRKMAGNFQVLWLYKHYLGRNDNPSIDVKYRTVRKHLHKKANVYNNDRFEESWTMIAGKLGVSVEPRLNSNEGGKDYVKHIELADIPEDYRAWHRKYNGYDYDLFYEFTESRSNQLYQLG